MFQRDSTKIEMWGGRCGVSTTSLYVMSVSVLGCVHTKHNAAAKIFHDACCVPRCDRVHVTLRLPITCLSNPTQRHHSKLQDSTVVLIPCYGNHVRTPPTPSTPWHTIGAQPCLLSPQRPVWCECSLNLSSWPKKPSIAYQKSCSCPDFFFNSVW